MQSEEPEPNTEGPQRKPVKKRHIVLVLVVIFLGMLVLDIFIAKQNYGTRRVGVLVMLVIGEVCLLILLRYIGYYVGNETITNKRGWSMATWFLFIVIYDIKLSFIILYIWSNCSSQETLVPSTDLEATSNSFVSTLTNSTYGEAALLQQIVDNGTYSVEISSNPMKRYKISSCAYSKVEIKLFSILQSIILPALYIILAGADNITDVVNFRHLDEIKMKIYWVVIDMLDVLQIQTSMWENNPQQLPTTSAVGIYLYCYVLLIALPSISLAELSKAKNREAPYKMKFYEITSATLVNVGITFVCILLFLYYDFNLTSSAFISKNVLCFSMQIVKFYQMKQKIKAKTIRENIHICNMKSNKNTSPDDESGCFGQEKLFNVQPENFLEIKGEEKKEILNAEIAGESLCSSKSFLNQKFFTASKINDKKQAKPSSKKKTLAYSLMDISSDDVLTISELYKPGLDRTFLEKGRNSSKKISKNENQLLDVHSKDDLLLYTTSNKIHKVSCNPILDDVSQSKTRESTLDSGYVCRRSKKSVAPVSVMRNDVSPFAQSTTSSGNSSSSNPCKYRIRSKILPKSEICEAPKCLETNFYDDATLRNQKFYSLGEHYKPKQKSTSPFTQVYDCKCDLEKKTFFNLHQAASDSDLSDATIPPPPAPLNTTNFCEQTDFETKSNQSTTV